MLDPCAGDGAAVLALREAWADTPGLDYGRLPVVAIEMERDRAARAKELARPNDTIHNADAFTCHWEGRGRFSSTRAGVLFLNPPYDSDRDFGRLEQRFLQRFTDALAFGGGLILVVPHYALRWSADYLATHYSSLACWRFPVEHFAAFSQVVVVGQRRAGGVLHDVERGRVLRWAADPSPLPELAPQALPAITVALRDTARLCIQVGEVDVPRTVAGYRPFVGTLTGTNRTVQELIGGRYEVALPPRPAHIALALSAGALNGRQIDPDRPSLPPILVKGVFERQLVQADIRTNSDGEVVGRVFVQRPRLSMTALRLDTGAFVTLRQGAERTAARRLEDMNTADFIAGYRGSLAELMREQFPAVHDPGDPAHQIALPDLPRRPFEIQRHLIQAGLKLLAAGQNPQLVAEVGTGKSTVSLSIAALLSPRYRASTVAELEAIGVCTRRLPTVRRVLIVCPPHLLKSWEDQAAAVTPWARVRVVNEVADLADDADVYILSRETAKLGHAVEGVAGGRCPRCGADIGKDRDALATSRARCRARRRLPTNTEARFAIRLGELICRTYPDAPEVATATRGRRFLSARWNGGAGGAARPLPTAELRALARAYAAGLLRRCHRRLQRDEYCRVKDEELHILDELATAAGWRAGAAVVLHRAAVRFVRRSTAHASPEAAERELFRAQWMGGAHGSIAMSLRRASERLLEDPAEREQPPAVFALGSLLQLAKWEATEACGEPLFQAVPRPRRFPLARYIVRRCRRTFDLLILDEAHEYSNLGTAQQKAAHRLVELPGVPTLALTGSLMGGYASSLFANLWALSPRFRREFRRTERPAFVTHYGYQKLYVREDDVEKMGGATRFGGQSDRELGGEAEEVIRKMGEAPGVLPTLILDHLLPDGLIMHKADLERELPPKPEIPVPIVVADTDAEGKALLAEFRRLLTVVTSQIASDRFTDQAGKLWGMMTELPSYLDRATEDLGDFVVAYPKECGGQEVARGRMFPASWVTPKERWLLERLRAELAEDRRCLVFVRHTGKGGIPGRLARLIEEHLGERPAFLDVRKVRASVREDWLDRQVVARGHRILLVNPTAVQTGLNNLVYFQTAIWHEGPDYNARVVRQANGRLHRIGQTREVRYLYPYYAGTVQHVALELVARKISASEQVDGLSIEGALESAGAVSEDAGQTAEAVMSIGRALFESWAAGE